MLRALSRTLCALLAMLLVPAAGAASTVPLVADHDVQVQRSGDTFTVDFIAHAPVPPERAWAVFTDFEHMADFVRNLHTSEVLERTGTLVRVRQTGQARYGIFSTEFDFVREFMLVPQREIRAHSVGGNIRRMDSLLRLEPEPEGTRLQYHAEVQPEFWLPPVIGPAFVRHETAEQFSAMIQEMLRRK